jgi:3-hydroxyacyl-CoA dehydrogenase
MTSESQPVEVVGVIGAGLMGQQIAAASFQAGMRVIICDVSAAAAVAAVERIRSSRAGARCDHSPSAARADVPTLAAATSNAELTEADLVIEAAPEDVRLKTELYAQLEPHLKCTAIVASNSSSLPISQLAAGWSDPGRFCGLHFCHPVSKRPLIEVVSAKTTSPQTLARAHAWAESLGMAPIAVRDSPGFVLNRLLVLYVNEVLELLLDGVDVKTLDRAAANFGLPMRPLALLDEFGIDVALAVGTSLYRAYPERVVPSELLIAVYKSGRRGRKTGAGFYESPGDADAGRLAPEVVEIISRRRRTSPVCPDVPVEDRLRLPILLEATRMLEESLVTDPDLIELVLRNGLGLTENFEGLFGWAKSTGTDTILEWLRRLQPLGNRFEPTQFLRDAAERRY